MNALKYLGIVLILFLFLLSIYFLEWRFDKVKDAQWEKFVDVVDDMEAAMTKLRKFVGGNEK